MAVDPKRVEHTSAETRVVVTKGWKSAGWEHSIRRKQSRRKNSCFIFEPNAQHLKNS